MTKYYYIKAQRKNRKKIVRLLGLGLALFGFFLTAYIFTPLIFYQINLAEVFASQNIQSPIPRTTIITTSNAHQTLLTETPDANNIDYTNAQNWFPTYIAPLVRPQTAKITQYTIAIPKIHVTNALVSTVDNNLALHLVNYAGTAIPPDNGNAVLFGHSTLPSLFDQTNYKTILANAYELTVGDRIFTTVEGKSYTYDIYAIIVIDPDDTSAFAQTYDNSYLTLITCTPPGTTLKRLVIKSRLRST